MWWDPTPRRTSGSWTASKQLCVGHHSLLLSHHDNHTLLPRIPWQPHSITRSAVATTFYHPQHCGKHSLLSTALGGHIPIPTAERPALVLTPATWQPPSPSQDAIATASTTRSPHLASVKPQAMPHQAPADELPPRRRLPRCLSVRLFVPHQHRHTCARHTALPLSTEPDRQTPLTLFNSHCLRHPIVTASSHRARHGSPHSRTAIATAHSAQHQWPQHLVPTHGISQPQPTMPSHPHSIVLNCRDNPYCNNHNPLPTLLKRPVLLPVRPPEKPHYINHSSVRLSTAPRWCNSLLPYLSSLPTMPL